MYDSWQTLRGGKYYIILSRKKTQNSIYALITVMLIFFNVRARTGNSMGKKENKWHIIFKKST